MDIENLNKTELLNLRVDIEKQLDHLDKMDRLKNRTNLSELERDDEIYCIHFNGSEIYKHDFVNITISERNDGWMSFSASSPMGCSSQFHKDHLNKHYFLSLFSDSMYFFTLKPENWKDDLKLALDFQMNLKQEFFDKEVKKLRNNVMDVICNNEINF